MKVLTFAGRSHHIHRLKPVMEGLRAAKHETMWITADNSINIDPNTSTLSRSGEPFIHALNFWQENTLDNIDKLTSQTLAEFYPNQLSQHVAPYWIAQSIREIAECLVLFRHALEKTQPDIMLILHFNNFWCSVLAYLCEQEYQIPCVAFQEGVLRHRDQKTQGKQSLAATYCTRLIVWSENARDAYLEANIPDHKIRVAGVAHIDQWLHNMQSDSDGFSNWRTEQKQLHQFDADAPLITFAPPQLHRYEGDAMYAINTLASWSARTGHQLALKLHPFESLPTVNNIRDQLAGHPFTKVIWDDQGILPIVSISDGLITQHSTVAVEAIALGVPIAEIDLNQVGVSQSLVKQNMALLLGPDNYQPQLHSLITKQWQPTNTNQWKQENLGIMDGKVTQRIITELEKLNGSSPTITQDKQPQSAILRNLHGRGARTGDDLRLTNSGGVT